GLIGTLIYLLMINVTLAQIESIAGQLPFDMRPFGYGPTDAISLLGALGVEGRVYYLTHQIPLDTLYPAMLALTLVAAICWFGQRMPNSKLVGLGIILSVGAALCDYAENLGIMAMILSWPDISIPLVYAASTATIFKSALTSLAVLLALLIGFNWARQPKAAPRPRMGTADQSTATTVE
ncbi:MAG: hypothetical protein QNL92_04435, partial [Octadecabacter sp.]